MIAEVCTGGDVVVGWRACFFRVSLEFEQGGSGRAGAGGSEHQRGPGRGQPAPAAPSGSPIRREARQGLHRGQQGADWMPTATSRAAPRASWHQRPGAPAQKQRGAAGGKRSCVRGGHHHIARPKNQPPLPYPPHHITRPKNRPTPLYAPVAPLKAPKRPDPPETPSKPPTAPYRAL